MISPAEGARIAAAAEQMNESGNLAPALPTDIDANWELIGHITAVDATLAERFVHRGERVYFGFLARDRAAPSKYIAVIRGTEPMSLVEWLEDGLAALVPAPPGYAGHVHAGFAHLYESTAYEGQPCAAAIAAFLGPDDTITGIGHSLGSALMTLLMADLARLMPGCVRGMLFASPKTGDIDYVQSVNLVMGGAAGYALYNYSRDLVPMLPLSLPGLRFVSLPNVEWITPLTAKVKIVNNIPCAHHATSYAAMLSGEFAIADNCVLGKNGPTN